MAFYFAAAILWETYLTAAAAGIVLALALSLAPRYRPFAQRVAAGIVGSIPGVVTFQLLALPILALMFGLFWLASRLLGPLDGATQVAWNLTVIATFLAIPLILSLIGFIVGWRIGARMAGGATLGRALGESRLIAACAARVGVLRSWISNKGGIV